MEGESDCDPEFVAEKITSMDSKEYKCDYCGFGSRSCAELRSHLVRDHFRLNSVTHIWGGRKKGNEETWIIGDCDAWKPVQQMQSYLRNLPQRFTCSECNDEKKTFIDVTEHMQMEHSGDDVSWFTESEQHELCVKVSNVKTLEILLNQETLEIRKWVFSVLGFYGMNLDEDFLKLGEIKGAEPSQSFETLPEEKTPIQEKLPLLCTLPKNSKCGKKFRNEATLRNHVNRNHSEREKMCINSPISDECGIRKMNRESGEQHLNEVHNMGLEEGYRCVPAHSEGISCTIGHTTNYNKERNFSKLGFKRHLKTYHTELSWKSFKSHIPELRKRNPHLGSDDLKDFAKNSLKDLVCNICGKTFMTPTILRTHQSICGKNMNMKLPTQVEYTCVKCTSKADREDVKYCFSAEAEVDRCQICKEEGNNEEGETDKDFKGDDMKKKHARYAHWATLPNFCRTYLSCFSNETDVDRCRICKKEGNIGEDGTAKEFKSDDVKKNHVIYAHCATLYSTLYKSKQSLEVHIGKVHNEGKVECPSCSYSGVAYNYSRHKCKKAGSPVEKDIFICSGTAGCKKSFPTYSRLVMHGISHCQKCDDLKKEGRVFKARFHTVHVEKFKCLLCNFLDNRQNLKKHMKKHGEKKMENKFGL